MKALYISNCISCPHHQYSGGFVPGGVARSFYVCTNTPRPEGRDPAFPSYTGKHRIIDESIAHGVPSWCPLPDAK